WTDERARIVLSHEIAHIRRGDWLAQMLGEVLRAIHWFNPLVWIVCRRLRQESEHACDDAVLGSGVAAADYASHLLDLARTVNAASQARHEVHSDRTGHFEFVGLPPGDYTLQVTQFGFAPVNDPITVAGRDLTRNVQLQLGRLVETINIRAAREGEPSTPTPD